MCGLLVFGVEVEKTYGTAYYGMINFWLMMLSNIANMLFTALMVYLVPAEYRGGKENFFYCGVGYSNILFGLSIIFAYKGNQQQNFFGLCKFEKKYVPWFYMILIFFTIPNSSFIGHFLGIVSGLMIKFGGLYVLFPDYEWIASFDGSFEHYLRGLRYLKATDEITQDFDSYMWTSMLRKIRMAFLKIRHKLLGYEYVRPMPDPVICPDSIELVTR
ncbi:uncharacterized protein at3g58460-like [Stylonychia lemnae]|uniref:Uncharacterized protein at3g58460-like n=1 Tax=Stylonychia lemnae TaxID=5949 RepID=A0A078A5P2_STYLE|nr:uncharacterized protein at3g58460-like [Stylonychia lemnae]|eukprot:CDW77565.1 uncharacterized protein at3g58460-like [Stylonychia lemnae]